MKKAWTVLRAALLAGWLTLAVQSSDPGCADEEVKVQGTIREIDPATGRIELQTAEGFLQFYVAPEDVEQFKVGDKVEVELEPETATEEVPQS